MPVDLSVVGQFGIWLRGEPGELWKVEFFLSSHKERAGFSQRDFSIRCHHNAWGDSGLLSWFGGMLTLTGGGVRCKACQTFELVFVRSSPRLNFMRSEVTGLFRRDKALMAFCEWTIPGLLCVLILMELFSEVLTIYNYRITLQEAAVGLCSGTLYPYYWKSLAFPNWSLTRPFDFTFLF